MKTVAAIVVVASFLSSAHAAIVRTCPSQGICYSLSVPDTTASAGTGDIYFQLTAPTSLEYVALGQGSGMAGSNMFVMYTSSDGGNVTVSPRLGTGYDMPLYDTSSNIEVLQGSGVSNGVMTANVRCSNCDSWSGGSMDFSESSAEWIFAVKAGSSLDSDDLEESIGIHDGASSFMFDLARARGGSADVNPFASTTDRMPVIVSSSDNTSSSSNSSSSSNTVLLAHGALASLAFVGLFPIGGILIRFADFTGVTWVHAALQMLGVVTYIAAFGLGVYMATQMEMLSAAHPIVGIVLLIIVVVQPISGWLHHRLFKKYSHRTLWSYVHLWNGRAAIVLGMVNGGLGLVLASVSEGTVIAYSVVTGTVGVAYIAATVMGEVRRRKRGEPDGEKSQRRGRMDDSSGSDENVPRTAHDVRRNPSSRTGWR